VHHDEPEIIATQVTSGTLPGRRRKVREIPSDIGHMLMMTALMAAEYLPVAAVRETASKRELTMILRRRDRWLGRSQSPESSQPID
jgi:hypothetical protein